MKAGNRERDSLLIRGALALWGKAPDGVQAAREDSPLGPVWRVTGPDGRSRLHPSISGALRHLRALLAPERAASRVLFVRSPGSGAVRDRGGETGPK